MKKGSFTLFLLVFIHFNLFSQMENQIVEVVVYQLDSLANREFITQKVNQQLTNFEGFVSRKVFQSVKEENVLMDWVIWESLEDAENAAKKLPEMKEFAPFMQSITKVNFCEHYQPKYVAGENQNFADSAVLELVIYKIKTESLGDVESTFKQVSAELQKIDGFQFRSSSISSKTANQFVDFLIWEDVEKAQNSMQIVEKNPKILTFFQMNESTLLFEHFKPLN